MPDLRREHGAHRIAMVALALLAAAVVLDAAATRWRDEPWLFEPGVVLEEGFELVGTALLLAVFAKVVSRRLPKRLTEHAG